MNNGFQTVRAASKWSGLLHFWNYPDMIFGEMGERTFKHRGRLGWVTFSVYTKLEMESFYKPWEGPVPSKQMWSLVPFQSGFLPVCLSPTHPRPTPTPRFGYYGLMAVRGVHSLTEGLLRPLWSDKDTALSSDLHHLLLRVSLSEIWQSSQTGKEMLFTQNSELVSPSFLWSLPLIPTTREITAALRLPAWSHSGHISHPHNTQTLSLFFFCPELEPNSLSP